MRTKAYPSHRNEFSKMRYFSWGGGLESLYFAIDLVVARTRLGDVQADLQKETLADPEMQLDL
jgi:hypothetical protein